MSATLARVTIALLHGFAGDEHAWDAVPVPLGRTVKLPGHHAPIADSWEANLDLVAAELDDEVVVGYSLGARVALGLVATGRCNRAVLIGVNPGIADPTERAARAATDAAWARLLRERGMDAFVAAWQAQPLFASQARFPDRVAARHARRLDHDPELLARSLETMGVAAMPDYRAVVDLRVDLVAGAFDSKYLAIHAALPARSHHAIADCGHDPTLDQPAALSQLLFALFFP